MMLDTKYRITEHLRLLRKRLTSAGLSLAEIAALAGMTRQYLSQCSMLPETRGSRTISPEALDKLRDAAVDAHFDHYEQPSALYLPPKRLWQVFGPNMALVWTSHFSDRAAFYAARVRGFVGPQDDGELPNLSEAERRCVDWTASFRDGLVSRQAGAEIAGVDLWSVGLVGGQMPGWRIVPTLEQVEAIEKLGLRNWTRRVVTPEMRAASVPSKRAA